MYILLKQSQRIEIVASSLPDTIDLNHLKRYLPASVDDKLYQVDTILWSKLDLVYGQCCNLWEKLQEGLLYISLPAKTSPYFVIETPGEVYKLTSRIRATSSFQLLPCDFEYTTPVQLERVWCKGVTCGYVMLHNYYICTRSLLMGKSIQVQVTEDPSTSSRLKLQDGVLVYEYQ